MTLWVRPSDFLVAPEQIDGWEYLTTIPLGWDWCLTSWKTLVVAHPDHRAREFDLVSGKWFEWVPVGQGLDFVEMDQKT